jgi:hypothetical protein
VLERDKHRKIEADEAAVSEPIQQPPYVRPIPERPTHEHDVRVTLWVHGAPVDADAEREHKGNVITAASSFQPLADQIACQ